MRMSTERKPTAHEIIEGFPTTEPEIRIAPLDEPPIDVEMQDLLWWLLPLRVGATSRWAQYEYPTRRLSELRVMEVTGPAKTHEEPCYEIRSRDYTPEGQFNTENYGYADVRNGIQQWFGWWSQVEADDARGSGQVRDLYTFKDDGFRDEWEDSPARIVDAGQFRWIDPSTLVTSPIESAGPGINPIGAGMYLVRVGNREHRCLRVIDVTGPSGAPWNLLEGYVSPEGRIAFCRHYYVAHANMNCWNGRLASEVLRDCPVVTCDGIRYHLWYDDIPADSL